MSLMYRDWDSKKIKSSIFLLIFGLLNIVFAHSNNEIVYEKYSQISKDDIVIEMLRSSNFDFSKWHVKPQEVNGFCDVEEDEIICQIGIDNTNYVQDETASFAPIGTILYNTLTSKLYDISKNLEEPKELAYNQKFKKIFNAINYDNTQE